MKPDLSDQTDILSRSLFFVFFALVGLFILVVFSPYRPMLELQADLWGRILLIATLGFLAFLSGKTKKPNIYQTALFGLFTLAVTVSAVLIFACYLLDTVQVDTTHPAGFALVKLGECSIILITVIPLSRLTGIKAQDLYLAQGNLKEGLTIGLSTFTFTAIGSFFLAPLFFGARELTLLKVLDWLPWILIFVLANATGEELLYRGVFLKKLEPLYGKRVSNLMITLVFTALHLGVTYPADQRLFLLLLIPLAWFWGYLTQKTGSLLASILFHAGMDVAIILGIFSTLSGG